MIKLLLFTYLLTWTPFFRGLPDFLHLDDVLVHSSVYEHRFIEEGISIKDQLVLMKVDEGVVLNGNENPNIEISSGKYVDNSIKEKKIEQVDTVVPAIKEGKKVYIYNTHQMEGYSDGKSVVDASVLLANRLQQENIQVVYETNSFPEYLKQNGLNYNHSYQASYFYLNEALVNYGGFDLVIDFHRDSVPRENAFVRINDKDYAKIMFVIGGLSNNVNAVTSLSKQLSQSIDTMCPGIVKSPMTIEAYFNQQVYENSVLIEVGSDTNTYEEVVNSTNLLADAIIQYLR